MSSETNTNIELSSYTLAADPTQGQPDDTPLHPISSTPSQTSFASNKRLMSTASTQTVYLGSKNEKIHNQMKIYGWYTAPLIYIVLTLIFLVPMAATLLQENFPTPVVVSTNPLEIDLLVPRTSSGIFIGQFVFTFLVLMTSLIMGYIYRHTFVVRNRTKGFNCTICFSTLLTWFLLFLNYLNLNFGLIFSLTERQIEQSNRSSYFTFFNIFAFQTTIFLAGVSYQCRFKIFYDVFITPEKYVESPPKFGIPWYFISLACFLVGAFPSDLYLEINGDNTTANILNQVFGNMLPQLLVVGTSYYWVFKTRSVSSRILNLWGAIRILTFYLLTFLVIGIWGIAAAGDSVSLLRRDFFVIHIILMALCVICFDSYIDPLLRYLYVVGTIAPPDAPTSTKRTARTGRAQESSLNLVPGHV
eukprot:Awhi_evm1s14630